MAFVYILFSKKYDRFYIGSTPDIERRVHEHNQGITPSTRSGVPWECVFVHQAESLIKARQLEMKIKSWKDRRLIERIVKDQYLRVG